MLIMSFMFCNLHQNLSMLEKNDLIASVPVYFQCFGDSQNLTASVGKALHPSIMAQVSLYNHLHAVDIVLGIVHWRGQNRENVSIK